MTTIVIEQAEVRLTPQQLVTALQLSPDELENVFRQLELPSWQARLDALLERVRQRAIQNPISDDEIDAEVNTARNEFSSSRS
jgi:hypothetical protein